MKGNTMKKLSITAILFLALVMISVSCTPTDTTAKIEELEEKITKLEEEKGQEQVAEETKTSETIDEEEISSEEAVEEGPKEFSPNIIGSLYISGYTASVHVVEDYAYVGGQGLSVIDITDKAKPIVVGSSSTSGWAQNFYIEGDFAYLPFEEYDSSGNSTGGGFQIIDITDKSAPVVMGTFESEDAIAGISVVDNYIYAIYNIWEEMEENSRRLTGSGIKIIDMTDKANLTVVGEFDGGSSGISSIYTEGDYAYIFAGGNFVILDITDRKNPTTKGGLSVSGWAQNFCIEGDFAYLPSGNTLQIIDLADKTNPVVLGGAFTKGDISAVSVFGDYAYITYLVRDDAGNPKESGMQVIDILEKSAPVIIASADIPGEALGIFVEGDYVYVAAGPVGLHILNLYAD